MFSCPEDSAIFYVVYVGGGLIVLGWHRILIVMYFDLMNLVKLIFLKPFFFLDFSSQVTFIALFFSFLFTLIF